MSDDVELVMPDPGLTEMIGYLGRWYPPEDDNHALWNLAVRFSAQASA